MLNTYIKAYNNLKVNAVTGTLIKSHPNSIFVSCHSTSNMADRLLSSQSKHYFGKYNDLEDCTVLQVMLTGGEKVDMLFEIVRTKDYLSLNE